MGNKSKKAATEKTSGKSVQTYAAESSQEQPLTTPDGSTSETASDVLGTEATTATSQSIAVTKKVSAEVSQHLNAIAMSSADLGKAIKKPTERITKHAGNAIAHEAQAKKERAEAQREFEESIAYYYEAKQRLLNPGYRTDVDGGKDRTPDDNQKWFGAPDWATFNKNCAAFSLQHADRKLKAFAKANGLLTDGGDNIDDVDVEETDKTGRPEPRRKEDATAQKRYEHIATAAMSIAQSDPENVVSKQIMAAAEHVPAPLMPVAPDIFTELLSFVTAASQLVAKLVKNEELRPLIEPLGNVKQLLAKLSLHRPAPEPAKLLAEATKEEKRKQGKRLAKKNGQALGSASYNPPNNSTSEDVQKSRPMSVGGLQAARFIAAGGRALIHAVEHASGQSPLTPGKKYTVRPAASGGYGIFEAGSSLCLQRHSTSDEAWEAVDAVKALPQPASQQGASMTA